MSRPRRFPSPRRPVAPSAPPTGAPAVVASPVPGGGAVLQQQEGRITEALLDFTKLPPAGTPYTLKITVTASAVEASRVIEVNNSEGTNDPKDTRNAVERAMGGLWAMEKVGDTKLRIFYYRRFGGPSGFEVVKEADILKVKIEATQLKDNQLPTKSLTRVSPPAGSGMSSSVGGTWKGEFAASDVAAVLPDDVVMNIRITAGGVTTTVQVNLLTGMTPEDAAQAVSAALNGAGYTSYTTGAAVQHDDPDGLLDGIEVEFTTAGDSPTVDWLATSIGFIPLDEDPPTGGGLASPKPLIREADQWCFAVW